MGVKISELAAASGATLAMQFEVNNTGTSQRLTLAQMFALSTGAVVADTPLLNFAQTWNNAAVAFNGLKLNITDTASAAGSKLLDLQLAGVSKFAVAKDGTPTLPPGGFTTSSLKLGGFNTGWSSAANYRMDGVVDGVQLLTFDNRGGSNPSCHIFGTSGLNVDKLSLGSYATDCFLAREAANTLMQRNGTSAQAFHLYNTFTDASNFERAAFKWSSNELLLSTEKLGTGAVRDLKVLASRQLSLASSNGWDMIMRPNDAAAWRFKSAGHFFAETDNTYDIGSSGGNRPRNLYVAGNAVAGSWGGPFGATIAEASSGAGWNVSGRLMFSGTTSTFPALKRSAQTLQCRLADDSDFAMIQGKLVTHMTVAAGAPTPDSYFIIWDNTGTTWKVPCELYT